MALFDRDNEITAIARYRFYSFYRFKISPTVFTDLKSPLANTRAGEVNNSKEPAPTEMGQILLNYWFFTSTPDVAIRGETSASGMALGETTRKNGNFLHRNKRISLGFVTTTTENSGWPIKILLIILQSWKYACWALILLVRPFKLNLRGQKISLKISKKVSFGRLNPVKNIDPL